MNTRTIVALMFAAGLVGGLIGAGVMSIASGSEAGGGGHPGVEVREAQPLVAQGPIHYAAYETEQGKLEGFTAVNSAGAVPGGNGSWNERRYGKLYANYLVVTKPQEKNWGVMIIPTLRLRKVHFLDE